MDRLAIIVAESEGALGAVAAARDCTIIPGTSHSFTALTTFKDPTMANAGNIDVGRQGWVALATRN